MVLAPTGLVLSPVSTIMAHNRLLDARFNVALTACLASQQQVVITFVTCVTVCNTNPSQDSADVTAGILH